MKRSAWLAVVVVLTACGGPNGNDPGRYGTVRVARVGAGAQGAPMTDGVTAMAAVGPAIVLADQSPDITIESGLDDPMCNAQCGVTYDFAARRAVVGLACATQSDEYLRRIAAHATGHLLGMGHVTGAPAPESVMRGVAVPTPPAFGRECAADVLGSTWQPTQADIDEYRRTHPTR